MISIHNTEESKINENSIPIIVVFYDDNVYQIKYFLLYLFYNGTMECQILTGKEVATYHLGLLKSRIKVLNALHITPTLRVILVGNNPASTLYTNKKAQKCKEIGIDGEIIALDTETTTKTLLQIINKLNIDNAIHGILVQLPLPPHIDDRLILESIDPHKDVDGFHTINIGRLQLQDARTFIPCTAKGIIELLTYYKIATEGKHIVIIGRSNIVGRPMAQMLSAKNEHGNATVTLCHSKTQNIAYFTRQADIIIAAIGKALFLTADMIKDHAILIDVGINNTPTNSIYFGKKNIVGDIDYDSVKNKAQAITPVPGGIGPMTIAMLMHNTIQATEILSKEYRSQKTKI